MNKYFAQQRFLIDNSNQKIFIMIYTLYLFGNEKINCYSLKSSKLTLFNHMILYPYSCQLSLWGQACASGKQWKDMDLKV